MSLHWVNLDSGPFFGRVVTCGDCAIDYSKMVLESQGDDYSESDVDTPEKAVELLNALDERDGAAGPRPTDFFFAPALGTKCETCGLVFQQEGAVA